MVYKKFTSLLVTVPIICEQYEEITEIHTGIRKSAGMKAFFNPVCFILYGSRNYDIVNCIEMSDLAVIPDWYVRGTAERREKAGIRGKRSADNICCRN